MKIISLNTWCGRAGKEGLLDFFRRNTHIDIFCLQEVWEGGHDHAPIWGGDIDTTMITNISNALPGYVGYFRPHYMDWYGLAIFARKELKIQEEGDIFVFKDRENAFDNDNALNTVSGMELAKRTRGKESCRQTALLIS